VVGSKPYQHRVIIDVLHDFLFGPASTVSAMTHQYFDPSEDHTNRFPISTIALVATAVWSPAMTFGELLTICRCVQPSTSGVLAGAYQSFLLRTFIPIYTIII
jgi:hypothetical protein